MPKWMKIAPVFVILLALLPPLLVARARVVKSSQPRIHLIPDMDSQPKAKAQQANALFLDNRAMRRPVAGTIARGDLQLDDALYRGKADGEWVTTIPVPVTPALMERGRQRYAIYCAQCHGLDGYGRGPVALRAEEIGGPWVPPSSYHDPTVQDRPVGHLYNTITNGIRTMVPYRWQIPDARDRWAIVLYVRALQRSQNADRQDMPPAYWDALTRREPPPPGEDSR
jgi:mono/diheme cytochrome c family protein